MTEIMRSNSTTSDSEDAEKHELCPRSVAVDNAFDRHSQSLTPKYLPKISTEFEKNVDEKVLEIQESEKKNEKREGTFTESPWPAKKPKVDEELKKGEKNLEKTKSRLSKSRSPSVRRKRMKHSYTPEISKLERSKHSRSLDHSDDESRKSRKDRIRKREQCNESKAHHNTSSDRRINSRDHRNNSQDYRNSSRDRRNISRDRRNISRDRRNISRDRRNNSRDHCNRSRDCRNYSRDRRNNSRDHRNNSRDRRNNSRDRRNNSRDRRNNSIDRHNSSNNQRNEKNSHDKVNQKIDKAYSGQNQASKDRDSSNEQNQDKKKENMVKDRISERQKRTVDLLTSRTGGAYIPPAKLRLMQAEITDKSSMAYQRIAWEALKKSIHGYINKVNVDNIAIITRELFKENLIRGRGLLCRSIVQAQAASPTFTHVYAALVAIINSKFPKVGELLVKRLIIQFKRAFRRGDKTVCLSSGRFIAHLVNQRVVHEILALEMLTLMIEEPTDDSVEVAIAFLRECGMKLTEVTLKGIGAIFDMLRNILHEGKLDKRVQYMIEVIFQVRKDGFKDNQSVIDSLELIEEDDQFTHLLMLHDATNPEDVLNAFKFDNEYEVNENKYKSLCDEILGSEDSESGTSSDGSGSDGESSSDDEEAKDNNSLDIIDNTEKNLTALRRTIYLTINSSLDFEECAHKLMKMKFNPGEEVELCHMFLDCCAEQRTYEKFYGLLAQRFCAMKKIFVEPFEMIFRDTYDTTHRLDTNRLRNVSKFFSHLLFTNAISWDVLDCIKLNEDDTTSSSRIFIKILFQELAEYMGLAKLNKQLKDEAIADSLVGLFPRDNPRNTRFSINFFTSIGLGGLTDDLRQFLKTVPKSVPAINAEILAIEPPKEASSSSSSSTSSSSSSSSTSSSSSSSSEQNSFSSSASSDDSSSDDSKIDKHLRKIKLKSKKDNHKIKQHHKEKKKRNDKIRSKTKKSSEKKNRKKSDIQDKKNRKTALEHNKSTRKRITESPLWSSDTDDQVHYERTNNSKKSHKYKSRMKSVEKQISDRTKDGHNNHKEKIRTVEEDKENRKRLSKRQKYIDDDERRKEDYKREFDRIPNNDDNCDYTSDAMVGTKSFDKGYKDKYETNISNLEANIKDYHRENRETEKQHKRSSRNTKERHDSERKKRYSHDKRSRSRERRSSHSERKYKSDRKFEERSDERRRNRYKN